MLHTLQKKERELKKKQRQERQQNVLTNFYGAGTTRSCRNRGPVNYTFGMVQILFGSLLNMCPESWLNFNNLLVNLKSLCQYDQMKYCPCVRSLRSITLYNEFFKLQFMWKIVLGSLDYSN